MDRQRFCYCEIIGLLNHKSTRQSKKQSASEWDWQQHLAGFLFNRDWLRTERIHLLNSLVQVSWLRTKQKVGCGQTQNCSMKTSSQVQNLPHGFTFLNTAYVGNVSQAKFQKSFPIFPNFYCKPTVAPKHIRTLKGTLYQKFCHHVYSPLSCFRPVWISFLCWHKRWYFEERV